MKTKFFGGLFLGLNIVLATFLLSAALSTEQAPNTATTTIEKTDRLMSEGFLGEVRIFAGNFAPRGWADCNGQVLAISQNSALFSILGTTYGGDGRTTFALPDLRGRMPIGSGQGPGLPNYRLGDRGGVADFTTQAVSSGSGVNAVNNSSAMPPYLAVRYIICMQGIFPSRS